MGPRFLASRTAAVFQSPPVNNALTKAVFPRAADRGGVSEPAREIQIRRARARAITSGGDYIAQKTDESKQPKPKDVNGCVRRVADHCPR